MPAVYLQLELEVAATRITGTFDSLAEGIEGVPVTGRIDGSAVELEIAEVDGRFGGGLSDDGSTLMGTLEVSGSELRVEFERREDRFAFERPQTPEPPFPYESADVTFRNDEAGIFLAGTITRPAGPGPFPAVVLVSGSGPQDRDETMLGHRPFAVLADAFTRNGIAALRFDDREVGESRGTFAGSLPRDFASDAAAAVRFLAEQARIDPGAVGIVGHSEGGMIAPLVEVEYGGVAFLVLLAGPGVPGADVLVAQNRDLLAAEGLPASTIEARLDWLEPVIRLAATAASDEEVREFIDRQLEGVDPALAAMPGVVEDGEAVAASLLDPWMRAFLRFDPAVYLEGVDVPVLALIGELDVQVSAELNGPALEAALAGNPDASVMTLAGLNHLFQNATTGAIGEYVFLTETFDPGAIQLIVDWILERV
jgi:alpha/beta superfamily hydrolase